MGKKLGTRCVHNIWIPDGSKDLTVNRFKHRTLLKDSLDKILAALMEEAKSMPFGAVWDYYCLTEDVPVGHDFIAEIQQYEKEELSKR